MHFNPGDIQLWQRGIYFTTYFVHCGISSDTLIQIFRDKKALNLQFNKLCQPIAPVNVENDFFAMIFRMIATDALLLVVESDLKQVVSHDKIGGRLKIPLTCDVERHHWTQIVCLLRNTAAILKQMELVSNDCMFCNSQGNKDSFDMVITFPGCGEQQYANNYSYYDKHCDILGGLFLIMNPFNIDLFFRIKSSPYDYFVVSRNSFALISGELHICNIGNYTCETQVYFTAFILPASQNFHIKWLNSGKEITKPLAVLKINSVKAGQHASNTLMPVIFPSSFISPIVKYKCINYLCDEEHAHFSYPYCSFCLLTGMHVERQFINIDKGYGLFVRKCFEANDVIICETVTDSFQEILSQEELVLRYNCPLNSNFSNDLPYVNEIQMPDGSLLYFDQTTRRGPTSLVNFTSEVPNCKLLFEVSLERIVVKLVAIDSIQIDDECLIIAKGNIDIKSNSSYVVDYLNL